MKPNQTRTVNLWCRLMHSEPMWPSHGQYECRTSGQRHRVCWDRPELFTPRALASHRKMLAQCAAVAVAESRLQCSYQ